MTNLTMNQNEKLDDLGVELVKGAAAIEYFINLRQSGENPTNESMDSFLGTMINLIGSSTDLALSLLVEEEDVSPAAV